MNISCALDKKSLKAEMNRALDESRFDEARSAGILLLGNQKTHFDALLSLVNIDMMRGCPEQGVQYGERAVRLCPDSVYARMVLGSCLFLLQRYEDALRHFEHAVLCDPQNEICLMGLIKAGLVLNETGALAEHIVSLYTMKPRDKNVQNFAGRWLCNLDQEGPRGIVAPFTHDTIVGCVFDPNNPQAKWTVEAFVDDCVLARGKADLPDEGLTDLGVGDGAFGFRLQLPQGVKVERLYVRIYETASHWYGIPLCFNSFYFDRYEGFLEKNNCGMLTGFAYKPAQPNERVVVRFQSDTGIKLTAKADTYKRELVDQRRGDGKCGFCVQWPWEKEGSAFALVHAYFDHSGEPLSGSPVVLHNPKHAADTLQGLARFLSEISCKETLFASEEDATLALRYVRERLPLLFF